MAAPPARTALVAQWWPLICKFANRYFLWSLADSADDLAGEIAVKALHYFPSYDPARGAFGTWLGVRRRFGLDGERVGFGGRAGREGLAKLRERLAAAG
jgi:hypothetical protein